MNAATLGFVDELKRRPDVVGVLSFGSWARGDNRPESDVDLVVIVRDGYRRCVEHRFDQALEIIYVTEAAAFDYWESHRDDAAGLWAVARILHDADGTMGRLEARARAMLAEGKPPLDDERLAHARFDTEDLLRHVEHIAAADPATAQMLLANVVGGLTELFFDVRGLWTTPPKQRLARIDELRPELGALLRRFYAQPSMVAKLDFAGRIIDLVF